MMDLFGILVYVNTNVINYVMLENISITKNCNCRKKLIDKLVAECSEGIDGSKMVRNATLNDYGRVCDLSTLYILLKIITFIILTGTGNIFIYFYWYTIKNCFNKLLY